VATVSLRRKLPELGWLLGWLGLFATMVTPLRPLTTRKEKSSPESEWLFIYIKFATLGKED
jgi:hypothetical protein